MGVSFPFAKVDAFGHGKFCFRAFAFAFLCFMLGVLHAPPLAHDLGVACLEVAVEKGFCSLPSCCSGTDSIRTTRGGDLGQMILLQ